MKNDKNRDVEDKVEVIDPSDQRYKNEEYFKSQHYTDEFNQYRDDKTIKRTYSYGCTHTGCGCTIGCFSIMLISFLLSILIYWLI